MSSPGVDPELVAATPRVSGMAATMTIIVTGLGYAVPAADPTILSTNIAAVRAGLNLSRSTGSFVASLATLTLAAAVLGAGALGDLYGKKRMYVYGLLGMIIFGLLAAAAPNGVVLVLARAGMGVAFAFLVGLSLAIVNDVFAPERRKTAIALFLAAGFAITAPLPAIGTWLAQQFGWRACFLVAPAAAVIGLVITVRYVPETPRAARRLDVAGLILIATALLGVVYGISRLEHGFTAGAVAPIVVGLIAGAGFVSRELRTPDPALDLRVFRSGPFNAAVIAGITWDFLTGGYTILFAFYLVTVRGESPEILGLLLIPTMVLQALAATGSGRAAIRFGDRAVLVTGLVVLLAGLLVMTLFGEKTSMLVLFLAVMLNGVGSAIVQTPQSTIMMASAATELGGAVSAVKAALGQAGYSLGPALFSAVGTWLFLRDGMSKLAEMGITVGQAREALRITHGGTVVAAHGEQALDPERARELVQGAKQSMLFAIHTLSLIMAVVPIVAIVLAFVLLRPKPARGEQSTEKSSD
jgi:MFS family permease